MLKWYTTKADVILTSNVANLLDKSKQFEMMKTYCDGSSEVFSDLQV